MMIVGFVTLTFLFLSSTFFLTFVKQSKAPVLVDISYNSGSHCARFPSLSYERCFDMVDLPLSTWPFQINRREFND